MLEDYPKYEILKDGTNIILRPMTRDDKKKLFEFFQGLPKDDRMYLRHDVANEKVIDGWVQNINYDKVLPILALREDRVIGDATLHRENYGWKSHVGEIRIVVDKEFRRKGLGALLAREIYFLALKTGIKKLVAEMMLYQSSVIRVFEKLGFNKEAILEKHVVDSVGNKHDLVIMTNSVEALWKNIQEYEETAFPSYPMEA